MKDSVNILYVEDNNDDVELLTMAAERYSQTFNIILDVVQTVAEAKAQFDINKHSIALIDCNLPDGEGTEIVRFIKDKYSNFSIFLLSGILTSKHLSLEEEYTNLTCLEKNYNKIFIEHILQYIK